MKLLFKLRHGLGDNAQFTIVLKHIKHYFPNCSVDMEVGYGKKSYFKSFTSTLYERHEDYPKNYDQILDVLLPLPKYCQSRYPSTKTTAFIKNVLKVKPLEHLFREYSVTITPEEDKLVREYVESLPQKPFILLHYIAKTVKARKSLSHSLANDICSQIIKSGCTPVILDWKKESPLPDQKIIFNPGIDNPIWQGTKFASAGTIASLIKSARMYIGIDSGPLHVAGCTKTPTLGIWHGHHPVNFFDLCGNVVHLIPNHDHIKGKNKQKAIKYFEENYHYSYYKNLESLPVKKVLECGKL